MTGRIKDVIIVRGVNHYPQDIEFTAQAADDALRPGHGAAFMAEDARGQEVERSHRHRIVAREIADTIREAVSEEHGLSIHDVVLVAPGTIPKTTSGKVQRRLTRELWRQGRLIPPGTVALVEDRPPPGPRMSKAVVHRGFFMPLARSPISPRADRAANRRKRFCRSSGRS